MVSAPVTLHSIASSVLLDVLKSEQTIIKTTGSIREYLAIVKAIVILAHNPNIQVTTDGIEETDQVTQMIALDRDYGQDYYFPRPMHPELAKVLIFPSRAEKNLPKRVLLP